MIYVKYMYNICRIYDALLTNKAEVAEEKTLISFGIFLVESPLVFESTVPKKRLKDGKKPAKTLRTKKDPIP